METPGLLNENETREGEKTAVTPAGSELIVKSASYKVFEVTVLLAVTIMEYVAD
ncbi:hypothetical protein GCM10027348_09630 [Hymenobacter tenuis]